VRQHTVVQPGYSHKRRKPPTERRSLPGTGETTDFRARLLDWFSEHGRHFPWRRRSEPLYRLIVTESLLQRTRAETVKEFYVQFFRRFPSWLALSCAPLRQLQHKLKPIGLWRRRSVALRALAREMVTRHGRLPASRLELEALPGVGQYVASAALLFARGLPEPLLDVNAARVLERHFGPRRLADLRYDPYLQRLARLVIRSNQPARVNWALLDLGALVCKPRNPLCHRCPVVATCRFAREAGSDRGLTAAPPNSSGCSRRNQIQSCSCPVS
jgi:A/G-specific adenine glycosylase